MPIDTVGFCQYRYTPSFLGRYDILTKSSEIEDWLRRNRRFDEINAVHFDAINAVHFDGVNDMGYSGRFQKSKQNYKFLSGLNE